MTDEGFLAPVAFDGITDCERLTIDVYEGEENFSVKETLLHEALHAFTCDKDNYVHNDAYNSSQHGDHKGFDVIAFQELQLIEDNPQLVAWITDGKFY